MATSERVLSDRYLATALQYLVGLAADGGGYTLRGVSGWAHFDDVQRATRMRMDGQLPRLFGIGLVDRESVGVRGARETWVYRVNGEGARIHADASGEACERIRAPGEMEKDRPVYIALGPLNALRVLRCAYDEGPERFGGRGWRTGRELTALVDELNKKGQHRRHFGRIDSMELKWLAGVGLAEKRDEKLAWGRDRPVVYWRVSDAGRSVRVLAWRNPRRTTGEEP
jgi:hypothetical protein